MSVHLEPASINAMKQTCVIVILAYFTLFQPSSTQLNINIILILFFHWISPNKMTSAVNFRTSQRHSRMQPFREQKRRRNNQSGSQHFPYLYNVM